MRLYFALTIIFVLVTSVCISEFLWPFDPDFVDLSLRLEAPSLLHPLGCDLYGRDVLQSVMSGTKITLFVALSTVFLTTVFGSLIGLISGYYGSWVDKLCMRIIDILMAFPGILIAMTMASILGGSVFDIIFAISITGWTSTARLVRGQVLSLKNRDYIAAAHSIGCSTPRVLLGYLLPAVTTQLFVSASFSVSGVILTESSLSFLGLGLSSGVPTWGALLSQGRNVLNEAPLLSVVPGVVIALTILAFNFLGDSLRDYFDPKAI